MFFSCSCLLFIICALCYGLVAAQEEGGAPVSPAKRIAALRRPVGKAAKATTTTTAAPAHDEAGEEDEYNEEGGAAGGENGQYGDETDEAGAAGAASSTTTTTEPPKKVGPVIRPFRSNDDFLNSLKRRQQNAKKHRAEKAPASKPAKKTDSESDGEQEEPAAAAAPAPAAPAAAAAAGGAGKGYKGNAACKLSMKRFSSGVHQLISLSLSPAVSRRKLTKPAKAAQQEPEADAAAEESEQQQKEEEPKPKRPLSSRLALRKRN